MPKAKDAKKPKEEVKSDVVVEPVQEPAPEVQPGSTQETSKTAPGIVPAASDKPVGKNARYFKSFFAGLSLSVNEKDESGATAVKVIARFFPYAVNDEGDTVRRGFLATSDKEVIDRLADIPEVEELTQKEYDKELKSATPLGYPMA